MTGRFLMLISRPGEATDLRKGYPDIDFRFPGFDPEDATPDSTPGIDERLLDRLVVEHRQRPFDAVVNRREKFVVASARIANRLGLAPDLDDPSLVRDKLRMREAIGDAFPMQWTVRGPADLARIPVSAFPVVLKPRSGFNSRAVVMSGHPDELRNWFARLHPAYLALDREPGDDGSFVVEQLVRGTEHTLEALVHDGRIRLTIVSDKRTMKPPYFIETGDTLPTRLSERDRAKIVEAGRRIVLQLRIRTGWTHIELRLQDGVPVLIEAAARMGGGYHGELIAAATGIDRLRTLFNLHLGTLPDPLQETPCPSGFVVGRRIVAYGAELVVARRSLARFLANKGAELLWPASPASVSRVVLGPPRGYKNTILEFMVRHPDAETADQRAEDVAQNAPLWRVPLPAIAARAWQLLRGSSDN